MKRVLLPVLFLFIASLFVEAQPRLQQTINENWLFYKGDISGTAAITPDGLACENVQLPHTWNIEDIEDDPFGWYRGIGWYFKTLHIPSAAQGKSVYICFEAANSVTQLYVNGEQVGEEHIGGYTPFAFDITDKVVAGESCRLAVKVNNSHNIYISPLSADFVFYGGIYRDVHLLITEPVHFDVLHSGSGIYITTPQVSNEKGTVEVKADVQAVGNLHKKYTVTHTLLDADRQTVTSTEQRCKTLSLTSKTMAVENPQLWEPGHPYLYSVVSEIKDEKGNVVDRVENPLGFRWFSFDKDKGFFINGHHLKLIGTNRHQDYTGYGNAITDDMHRYDMQLLRDLGTNCLRISHYPHDPSVLEMCDRLGLVAFEEIPNINYITQEEQYTENGKKQITEMIHRDFNHPCIVAWNSSNETTLSAPGFKNNDKAQYERDMAVFFDALYKHIKATDPTRYAMVVHCGSAQNNFSKGFHCGDIIGYNIYAGWYWGRNSDIWKSLDDLKADSIHSLFLAEYGGGADTRIRSFSPLRYDHAMEYQVALIKEHLKAICAKDFLAGATIWNFADFFAEQRADVQPHLNNKGIVTSNRKLKDAYYYFKTFLSKEPYLAIPSKMWTRRAGNEDQIGSGTCTQPVEVFANVARVELRLNGKSLGVQETNDFATTFQVPFSEGENSLMLLSAEEGKPELCDMLKIQFTLYTKDLKNMTQPFHELAVNVGAHFYFIDNKKNDYLWLPDQPYTPGSWGYVGGKTYWRNASYVGSDKNIVNTVNEPLYQTQLTGLTAYKFDVPAGNYEVTLHFAELTNNKERTFTVSANGTTLWENINLCKDYGNVFAVNRRFNVTVEDKGLTVEFTPVKGETVLNGIVVRRIY